LLPCLPPKSAGRCGARVHWVATRTAARECKIALPSTLPGAKMELYARAPIIGGRYLLREHMRARKARYDDGRTAAAVWPEIRDQVLVQATLYFARIAAG